MDAYSDYKNQFCCIFRERSEFEKKGIDPAVVELRYKHYQGRLIETLN